MSLFLELIQVALNHREKLSRIPTSKEWEDLLDEASRQAVAGICIAGVDKLPKEQIPPQMLLLEWIGLSEQIRQQNVHVDKLTAKIWRQLKEDGLDAAILKGQGIAHEYGELAILRQSGDIDIWVKGGYQTVCDYVQQTHPTNDVAYHRFHYEYFEDIEVELHHKPTLMRNLLDDRKLARWYNSFGADSFVYLKDKGFAVPPAEFNRIFILTHIYRHFLFEGIGLRQVVDYYFVLKGHTDGTDNTDIQRLQNSKSKENLNRNQTKELLKNLRLTRFAEAIMWILHTQLGLEEQFLICGMNEKEGRFVLSEIEQTGNFGYGDTRYQYKRFFKLRRQMAHGAHLLAHYPSEVTWTPIWLMYHKVWKWNKVRLIRKRQK